MDSIFNGDRPGSRAAAPTRETVYAAGFSKRKQSFVRDFLADMHVRFVRNVAQVPPAATLAVWGNTELAPDVLAGRRILRIEDGFIRSVGLGAELSRPLSLVVDACGLYFDATRPSALESLLQHTNFDTALLGRAASLQRRVVAAGITKYNVGSGHWRRPAGARRIVLAVGQVEGDAALRYGAPGVRTNLGLLQAIRRRCPDAYVVYKPHPDVLAGLRAAGADHAHACRWCDEIVTAVPMSRLLAQVDEVHVMTSLAGFEALLRGREVTTYGQPFYAGWGLTNDVIPQPRRTRRLVLDELIAGALILYPRYVDPVSRTAIAAEQAVDLLIARRDAHEREPATRRLLRAAWRAVVRVGVRTMMAER